MWARSLLLLCAASGCLGVLAGVLHDKARSGETDFFDDNIEANPITKDELNEREAGSGQTPLMAASLAGKHLVVDRLLRLGADHTITERDGYNPPHGVAFQGRPEAAQILVEHGVPMDVAHADGFTPLHRTVWGGKPQHLLTAQILVKGGADVNHLDAQGFPPSHKALDARWVEMLRALLDMGADPNIRTRLRGDTLLHAAVRAQSVDIVALVVEAGGDVSVKNDNGLTPKGLAKQMPSTEIRALMETSAIRRRGEHADGVEKQAKEAKEEL